MFQIQIQRTQRGSQRGSRGTYLRLSGMLAGHLVEVPRTGPTVFFFASSHFVICFDHPKSRDAIHPLRSRSFGTIPLCT